MATPKTSFRKLKILLVGDTGTGKHCYVRRIIDNKYPRDSWTNKECDAWPFKYKIDEDTTVTVQILIIQGAARGKTILKKYYKDIDGFIIMFDVTDPLSYDNVPNWKGNVDAENNRDKRPPCILLANKCDLEKNDAVNEQMQGINDYCEIYGFRAYFETSSKDNIAIQQSFQHLVREIIQAPIPPVLELDSQSRPRSSTASEPRPDHDLPRERLPSVTQEYTIKIIVIGELGTGKTAVIQRYVRNVFSAYYRSTIGADMGFKKIHHQNDIVNVHIWDIAGDERFGTMTQLFYKDTAGCIIVFDESRSTTLHGAAKWKEDFDTKVNYDPNNPVPCILVGNKCDLPKEGIIQSEQHMKNFCQAYRFVRWFQTSAKDGTNITDTFAYLINQIMENITNRQGVRRRIPSDTIRIHETRARNNSENTCCSN